MALNRGFRARQRLGKYRIEKRLACGPYATVYAAADTIEGQRVALKIPNPEHAEGEPLDDFKREVRLAARLYHPNILPLKDASFIDGHLVIVTPLGSETLAHRMKRRMSNAAMVSFADQILEALAYAHAESVLHCDVKPENLILFGTDHLMLADFGIAKTALRTIKGSGSGTLGYLAPEQAMGRPSPRSDVFAAGLLLYRMFAGHVPEWPFKWPPEGIKRLRARFSPETEALLKRAMEPLPARRFRDAQHFYSAFTKLKRKGLVLRTKRRSRVPQRRADWQDVRIRQFKKLFGRQLEARYDCAQCGGPISERMLGCPWCGADQTKHEHDTAFPAHCPTCYRGTKLDWSYCATCDDPGFELETSKSYSDKRYTHKCHRKSCGGPLMPFMRRCPWCHTRTRQEWSLAGSDEHCSSCGWGVADEFWSWCPWCRSSL